MSNKFIITALIICSLFLWGCPYETEVAIDSSPNMKADARLLGTWKAKSNADSKFVVTKAGDNEYKIEEKKKEGKSSIYHAFLSDVKGTLFMNVKDEDGLSSNYCLFKVQVNSATSVTMYSVTENITEKFSTSGELRKFVEKNKDLSFFYEKSPEEYSKQ